MIQFSNSKFSVKDAMTTNPVTLGVNATVNGALNMFEKEKLKYLPLVDRNNTLHGFINDLDMLLMVEWTDSESSKKAIDKNDYLLQNELTKELITRHIFAVFPEESLYNCYEVFNHKPIEALPVIDSESRLIGVITPVDIIDLVIKNKELVSENPGCI